GYELDTNYYIQSVELLTKTLLIILKMRAYLEQGKGRSSMPILCRLLLHLLVLFSHVMFAFYILPRWNLISKQALCCPHLYDLIWNRRDDESIIFTFN